MVTSRFQNENPSLQGGILGISWSAEKMNVIWQDDEPTNQP
jgi:hypothetical protein